jgi:hypothetical protein
MACIAFSGVTGKSGVLRLLSCGKRVINKVVIFNLVIIKPLSEMKPSFGCREMFVRALLAFETPTAL